VLLRSIFTAIVFIFLCTCGPSPRQPKASEAPVRILWAWERPEDLRFIDTENTGVAFLAQTLILESEDVRFRPRRQPLEIPDGTYLIAVTRIESVKETERRPVYSDLQIERLSGLIRKTLESPGVRGVQIDFDAIVSERGFYRDLISYLRNELPPNTPLTITALASWCVGDLWLQDLDVDEAVPMAFVMGADSERIRTYLSRGNDWREPLCRESYGLSVDEPPIPLMVPSRRTYYFKNGTWEARDLSRLR
jgi:hypothetical protein